MTDKKLEWIQVLRGLAALLVVLFHACPHWDASHWLEPASAVFDYGFAGVDIFFVLSGFVVYQSSLRASCAARFVWNRFARVYSGYWPVFLVFIVLPLAFNGFGDVSTAKMLGSFFLTIPDISDNLTPTAWSLGFELWFYLWIAAGLIFFKNSTRYYAALFLILSLWNFFFLNTQRDMAFGSGQPLRYVLTGLGLEFLMGVFLVMIYDKVKSGTIHPCHHHGRLSLPGNGGVYGRDGIALV